MCFFVVEIKAKTYFCINFMKIILLLSFSPDILLTYGVKSGKPVLEKRSYGKNCIKILNLLSTGITFQRRSKGQPRRG